MRNKLGPHEGARHIREAARARAYPKANGGMRMHWEVLSGEAFAKAVDACEGICLLPLGVLEYHGPHLPLGTHIIRAHRMASKVAEVEAEILFPALPFTMNIESKIYRGRVAIRERLVFDLLENICVEIGLTGLHKIVTFSGHGGNK